MPPKLTLSPTADHSLPFKSTSSPRLDPPDKGDIVVFSGGSAANNLVDVFGHLRSIRRCTLSYVVPISDNGGSSSELIRVFGGPGIGDIRSRLVRLIPEEGEEASAIKLFFNHRLPETYDVARAEWLNILEANHFLWNGISSPKRELIRSILNTTNLEMLKRLRPSSRFDFSHASIGNLFLTGARLFTGSFEASIYLLSSICAVPSTTLVIPALNTNFVCHISAGLMDGTVIIGQNNISHPSLPTSPIDERPMSPTGMLRYEIFEQDKVEDANIFGTLPSLRKAALAFSKEDEADLPSRIDRVWYNNPYGQEITIPANPRVLDALSKTSCIIYSIGSLFTSIVPSLILRGVGDAITSPVIRTKILILNGTLDRETGPPWHAYTALDFVGAIANACADSQGLSKPDLDEYARYVTHVIYLDGPDTPAVSKETLNSIGIEAVRVYGRRDPRGKGGRYDAKALSQALEAIVGRKDSRGAQLRRNTLVT